MGKKSDSSWLFIGGGALALAAFMGRKQIVRIGNVVLDQAKILVFKRVIPAHVQPYADVILKVAAEQDLNPFVIVALGERESGWGKFLDQNGKGDNGHGHGIMQIDDRTNAAWLASTNWRDSYSNVTKGAKILVDKIRFFQGKAPAYGTNKDGSAYTISNGINVFIGPINAKRRGVSAGKYPDPRPLSGDKLNQAALAAYNSGTGNVIQSIAAGLSPDATTTGSNYSKDVSQKVASLTTAFTQAGGGTGA